MERIVRLIFTTACLASVDTHRWVASRGTPSQAAQHLWSCSNTTYRPRYVSSGRPLVELVSSRRDTRDQGPVVVHSSITAPKDRRSCNIFTSSEWSHEGRRDVTSAQCSSSDASTSRWQLALPTLTGVTRFLLPSRSCSPSTIIRSARSSSRRVEGFLVERVLRV
jgi:hypothetical protein